MIRADDLVGKGPAGCWPQGDDGSGRWLLAAPVPGPWTLRLRDAWEVFRGRAEAVRFRA